MKQNFKNECNNVLPSSGTYWSKGTLANNICQFTCTCVSNSAMNNTITVPILTLADSCILLEFHIIHGIVMVTIGIAEHNLQITANFTL